LVSEGGPTGHREIQIKPLVKRLTFPFAGIRYVAVPLRFWSPGTPKGARRPRHAPSAWRGRCLFFVENGNSHRCGPTEHFRIQVGIPGKLDQGAWKSTTPLERSIIARRRWFSHRGP